MNASSMILEIACAAGVFGYVVFHVFPKFRRDVFALDLHFAERRLRRELAEAGLESPPGSESGNALSQLAFFAHRLEMVNLPTMLVIATLRLLKKLPHEVEPRAWRNDDERRAVEECQQALAHAIMRRCFFSISGVLFVAAFPALVIVRFGLHGLLRISTILRHFMLKNLRAEWAWYQEKPKAACA